MLPFRLRWLFFIIGNHLSLGLHLIAALLQIHSLCFYSDFISCLHNLTIVWYSLHFLYSLNFLRFVFLKLLEINYSVNFLKILWVEITQQIVKIFLHSDCCIERLVLSFLIKECIFPYCLNIVKDLLDHFIFSFIVLSSY